MKRKILFILIWIAIWQLLSLLIHNPVVMAGPIETAEALLELLKTGDFYKSVGASLLRIMGGVFFGFVMGAAFAVGAYKSGIVMDFLEPVISLIKTIPVVSFVIILLIWQGSRNLAFFIVMLVVLPITYTNILNGLRGIDGGLLEVASTYRMTPRSRLKYIYLPGLRNILLSIVSLGVGMGFKSGVAAEVIGQPLLTIGNGLYRSKIYLETAGVFAWTAVIIILSAVIEKMLKCALYYFIANK